MHLVEVMMMMMTDDDHDDGDDRDDKAADDGDDVDHDSAAADDDGGDGVTKKPDEVCSGALGKPFFWQELSGIICPGKVDDIKQKHPISQLFPPSTQNPILKKL